MARRVKEREHWPAVYICARIAMSVVLTDPMTPEPITPEPPPPPATARALAVLNTGPGGGGGFMAAVGPRPHNTYICTSLRAYAHCYCFIA